MADSKKASISRKTEQLTKEQLIKNVQAMQIPTNLLKFGSSGRPGFRMFLLSDDVKSLTWQSKNKSAGATKVDLAAIRDIKFGQRTEKFRKNGRADLEHLSFSLIYEEDKKEEKKALETLDLVCKDEKEFQLWTKTLTALLERISDAALMQELSQLSKGKKMAVVVRDTAGIQGANDVYAFGWGEWGQNGFGQAETDSENQTTPRVLETLLGKGVTSIASGWSHTIVLLETGQLMSYGNRIASGHTEDIFVPTPLPGINEKTGVVSVACGAFHCVALTANGAVLTWGSNLYGQLGHGDTKDCKTPTFVEELFKAQGDSDISVEQVACGSNFTAALTDDGKVYTWGCGEHGALGHNDTKDYPSPKLVNDLAGTDVRLIACGDGHMFACTDRDTYGWGWNACGQVGNQTTDDQLRPQVIDVLRGNQVESIACGAAHSVASVLLVQLNSYMVYSWGSNHFGQLGQGKTKRVLQPTPIPKIGKQHVVEVRCGSLHTILRTENFEVFSAGSNKYGQLGQGSAVESLDEFKLIDGLKGKSARGVACGGENSAVLTARAWVQDEEAKECMACKVAFSLLIRRHHCRNCGGIFCGKCSDKKMAILKYGVIDPVRVCTQCYEKLGGR